MFWGSGALSIRLIHTSASAYVLSTAIRWGFWGLFRLHHALHEAETAGDDPDAGQRLAERVEHLTDIIAFTLRIP